MMSEADFEDALDTIADQGEVEMSWTFTILDDLDTHQPPSRSPGEKTNLKQRASRAADLAVYSYQHMSPGQVSNALNWIKHMMSVHQHRIPGEER